MIDDAEFDALKSAFDALRSDVDILKPASAKHGADLSHLQQFQDDFDKNVNEKLDPAVKTLEDKVRGLQDEITVLRGELTQARTDLASVESAAEAAQGTANTAVSKASAAQGTAAQHTNSQIRALTDKLESGAIAVNRARWLIARVDGNNLATNHVIGWQESRDGFDWLAMFVVPAKEFHHRIAVRFAG